MSIPPRNKPAANGTAANGHSADTMEVDPDIKASPINGASNSVPKTGSAKMLPEWARLHCAALRCAALRCAVLCCAVLPEWQRLPRRRYPQPSTFNDFAPSGPWVVHSVSSTSQAYS